MKSPYVGGLVPNEVVTVQFIVINKEIRQKKTGEPYLSLQLADRTGEIEAKMWDNVEEVMHSFDRDDFVKAKGLMQVYQKRAQFTIHRLRRLDDSEVDFGDYFPCSERNLDEMFKELQDLIAGMGNPHLRTLLEAVLGDKSIAERFKIAPAAKSIHHACRGGLLEHVLSLCTLARLTAGHYKNVDLDLVLTGAVLHDIGKIEELSYHRSFGYSSEGQLLGHIVIGLKILADKIREVPDFPPRLRTLLEHLVISHHGELEFGSPKVPSFPEALLLHHLDNMDSKMEAMRSILAKASPIEADFTGWVPSLERTLLRKEQFLQGPSVAAPATPQPSQQQPPPVAVHEAPVSEPPIPAMPHIAIESTHQPPGLPDAAPADRTPPPPREKADRRPAAPTLFGEKLQAVLGPRK
ncbi:MAG: 3'-5' exoribonuclease YhaM family protein [Bryobacteraceae bacterium]